ncbi:LacI family DNA-binding transcriptional regulator [Edaphobacter modestus]|uniref:LacI family transcriptional regulator n=1 Tax=Edaphobacter modestus TaxID=388466 RepID=A0A4Q7YV74_9BACT|nr:LacI family DNA-binding transcriptional regulator [Edaphobacter modestus]RZU41031.1 LacI family transcriptional regulator [Edaphobacter modestus]
MPKPSSTTPGVRHANLKMLAQHLGLSPSTVSFVLNNTPGRSIPESTRARVKAAAEKFNYQPSMIARTLQGKRMQTVGILLPELGEGYHSQVLSGVGDLLMRENYFYFTVHHRHRKDLIDAYPNLLRSRGVDGILAIDSHLDEPPPLPTVTVAGHTTLPGVSNVLLDEQHAARLSLQHLRDLGHHKIALMHGQPFSSDADTRWFASLKAARELGIEIHEELMIYLSKDSQSPEISYPGIRKLIKSGHPFTAVLCFNDVAAMGTIRALHEAGLRVPDDVSVLGFDDIQSAAYQVPSLTTIRQPLQKMGSAAAQLLLKKLAGEPIPEFILVAPELVVRESTAPARRVAAKKTSSRRSGAKA